MTMRRLRFSTLVVVLSLAGMAAVWAADVAPPAGGTELPGNKLVVHADGGKHAINRNIYGHFAEHLGRCVYEGFWVGEDSPIPNTRGIRNDVVAALRRIKAPVLRWPGGCFADDYHWQDGIGPRKDRPAMVNAHWGAVTENNHFGTLEFFDLCEQIGCEPYICGNVGSGTVREMQQWVEYITFPGRSPMADLRRANGRQEPWKLPFFGIGNENWGCGGQMTAEYYADQYRRFSTYVQDFGGNKVSKIACGPRGADYHWTDVLMRQCGPQIAGLQMAGLALHYYCGSGKKTGSATKFDEEDWFHLLRNALVMEELVTKHAAVMDKYDPQKRVALVVDEWGTWHAQEPGTNPRFLYQQNTLRDAMVAAATLNIFNRHCDRVRMANIAQTVNVLQAMILTDKERMVVTPTYHVFEMYSVHQDAVLLPIDISCDDYRFGSDGIPGMSASASRDKAGRIHVSLCNLNPKQPAEVACELRGLRPQKAAGRLLTAAEMTAHNTFQQPENVKPTDFAAFRLTDSTLHATIPPKSVVVLEVQ